MASDLSGGLAGPDTDDNGSSALSQGKETCHPYRNLREKAE